MNTEEEYRSRARQPQPAKKKKNKKRYVIILILEILLLLVLGAGILAWITINKKMDMIQTLPAEEAFVPAEVQTNPDRPEAAVQASKGYTTIMFYGVDARNNKDLLKDANADTDIICCINNDTYEVKLVSVLRDTFLETTSGKHRKLTDIYAGYGVRESLETVNRNFDLAITKYVAVNWKAVANAINLMGGLEMEITTKEIKNINSLMPEVTKTTGISSYPITGETGTYHLDGIQAVCYARIRNVVVNDEGHDIGRATRQRKVISAMLAQAKTLSLSELNTLCNEIFPGISTNIELSEILGMAVNLNKYSIADQGLFPFEYIDQQNLTTAYVYCNTLTRNVSELQYFLYGVEDYEPSRTVQEISEYITEYRHEHP